MRRQLRLTPYPSLPRPCLLLLPLLLFTFLSLSPSSHANVVFEEIGQMSGSTSYIHLSITVDLESLETRVDEFSKYIAQYRALVKKTYGQSRAEWDHHCGGSTKTWKHCDEGWRRQMDRDEERYLHMSSTFDHDAGQLKSRIRNLRGILPSPVSRRSAPFPSFFNSTQEREKRGIATLLGSSAAKKAGRFIFKAAKNGMLRQVRSPGLIFSLARGILGTFMGMYTQYQIDKLRNEVDDLRTEHNQLVEVVTENRASIVKLEHQMYALNQTLTLLGKLNSGIVVSEISSMYRDLHSALEIAVHAVQQAMHRRMSIDLLSPTDLEKIFEDLTQVALEQGFHLLTEKPSDLLQVEASHIFDGSSFILLLHVPMTPADSLLRLLRLRPFPIPFSPSHSLLPRAPTSLLALSKGRTRLMTTVEYSDLVGCHQIGNIYICDRHGALKKDIKSNCLGALFEQDIPEARKLCDLEVVPRKEAVLQLEGNWFLVYSPEMYTAQKNCHNGTSSDNYIKRDVQKVYVDPGCTLFLRNHQLSSEFSLYLDSNVRWVKWDKEDISLFGLNEEDVEIALNESGMVEREILLAEIVKSARTRTKFPAWRILLWTTLGISFISLIALVAVPIFFRWTVRLQARLRKLKELFASLIPSLAEHVNHLLRHLNLPQIPLQRFHLYPALPAENPAHDPLAPEGPAPQYM